MKPLRIAVIGAGAGEANDRELADARRVGELLAPHATVITGGRGGVMAAASEGVTRAGGAAVGLLPRGEDEANAFLTLAIPTGLGEARNVLVATAAHGVVAVGGKYGTLSEIGFALKLGRPIVGVRSWTLIDPQEAREHLRNFDTPDEAVAHLLRLLERG